MMTKMTSAKTAKRRRSRPLMAVNGWRTNAKVTSVRRHLRRLKRSSRKRRNVLIQKIVIARINAKRNKRLRSLQRRRNATANHLTILKSVRLSLQLRNQQTLRNVRTSLL